MAKHVLHTNEDELDFFLLGIVCQENQYSIVSLINDALDIDLTLSSYLPFNLKTGKTFKFSLFSYYDEVLGIQYDLVPNASNFEEPHPNSGVGTGLFEDMDVEESVKLIKELPRTDYFLIMKGEELHLSHFKVMDKLKTIAAVIQLQSIQPAELPSRRNLIF